MGCVFVSAVFVQKVVLYWLEPFSSNLFRVVYLHLKSVELSPLCLGNEKWDDIFSGNPKSEIKLEHLYGWTYKAYGQITQVDPVIIDCGIITIKDEIQTHDERCIGKYVAL